LKSHPVIGTSCNESYLGNIRLRKCEVVLNSTQSADLEGKPRKLKHDAFRASKSKTRTTDKTSSIQHLNRKNIPVIKHQDNAITARYLKSQPFVGISRQERQMGEISLKKCEVALDFLLVSELQG